MLKNDPTIILNAMKNFATMVHAVDINKVDALKDTAFAMGTANSAVLDKTLAMYEKFNQISVTKIQQIIRLLGVLGEY